MSAERTPLYYWVLGLRLGWLVPFTLVAAVYAAYLAFSLATGHFKPGFALLVEAAIGYLLGLTAWRSWKKTAQLWRGELVPLKEAVLWQAVWFLLVVAVPAAIIWPKVSDLQAYVGEGRNKGSLAAARLAAGDIKSKSGRYPASAAELAAALPGGAFPALWDARFAHFPHPVSSGALDFADGAPKDTGGWAFVPGKGGAAPSVFIDCTHTDRRGLSWSAY